MGAVSRRQPGARPSGALFRLGSIAVTFLLASCFLVASCLAPAARTGAFLVSRVIDGDTIVLSGGGRVRYIGIDAPEVGSGAEAFGREATQANVALVEGKSVRLERDVSETDRYGRLLRYVWVDGKMVNLELVRMGLAEAKAYPPDTRYQALLDAAEVEARLAGRGMWGK